MITYNANETIQWLQEHSNSNMKAAEVCKLLTTELETKSISDIIIHLKQESLLKAKPIESWEDQKSRPILWQRFAVSAIFSPIFKVAKLRFKSLLK